MLLMHISKKVSTYTLPLETKDEVIDWMLKNQLDKRNLTDTQIAYFRGLQYEREKAKHGGDRKSDNTKSSGESCHLVKTAEKLATQHKVSERTIRDDGSFAKAVDKIASNFGQEIKNKILTKEVQISKDDVRVLSNLPVEEQEGGW
ncbi:conserved hypothetical protein [Desulfitobacterium hafniense DCB-2]|uniref:Uncharacterized protein n=1 Tax=Desulfitobacterium hafniense (strain DSM 10664 / DCB-2) TaxID=272564 RepID=B8FNX2_DESHD|nr:hypothetical protein [Desulfitobacterium hafniense]ACL19497.1 conserved hypothetical protein [Desulfitobacterium hafniense DCB-2]